jgi:amino acid adenylation domain-containing protein
MPISITDPAKDNVSPVEVVPHRAPLSFAQERMWFDQQLAPESYAFNEPLTLRLQGSFNYSALAFAVTTLLQKHDILRTKFDEIVFVPNQIVLPRLEIAIPFVDLLGLPERDRLALFRSLLNSHLRRPFVLQSPPLMRIAIFRIGSDEHVLSFVTHHILCDEWSGRIFLKELEHQYQVGAGQDADDLPSPRSVQYADYAIWERDGSSEARLTELASFWKSKTSNFTVCEVPGDYPRKNNTESRAEMATTVLDCALSDRLRSISRSEKTTLSNTLLAGFLLLIDQYSGLHDLSIGIPVTNRTRSELQDVIGYFINMLVLRTNLAECASFVEAVRQTSRSMFEAYSHQSYPFEQLVKDLRTSKTLDGGQPVRIVWAYHGLTWTKESFADLTILPFSGPTRDVTQFDLECQVQGETEEIGIYLRYNAEVYSSQFVEKLLGSFRTLLRRVANDPTELTAHLVGLSREDKRVLSRWNATGRTFEYQALTIQMFEEHARSTPDSVALSFGPNLVTFSCLNAKANRFARHLRNLGVGPEVRVAVSLERGPNIFIAFLAIQKAGGVYVPVDPAYPRDRIAFMIDDADCPILVCSQLLLETRIFSSSHCIAIDIESLDLAEDEEANLECPVRPDNLAYMIYTSGSTGHPKAVCISHCNLDNLLGFQREVFKLGLRKRVFQFSSLSFDATIWEIGASLFLGGCLILPSTGMPIGLELLEILRREQVQAVLLPPSVLGALPEAPIPSLELLVVGGEACPPTIARKWSHERRMVNAYGPTEYTVVATIADRVDGIAGTPIGRPIANTSVYLLDEDGKEVPIGAIGEIYIGGAGVARGYLHRAEQTADRFVPDGLSMGAGRRLYRTGDLARWRMDGNLEYIRRRDNQVKLRGFRIELSEVESVLLTHPSVLQCVVLLREFHPGDQRLVAYVVARHGWERITASELRMYLQKKLPDYMLPSAFMPLDELPMTPNGKLDSRSLPEPWANRAPTPEEEVTILTPVGEIVRGVWGQLLKVEGIKGSDSFFELGGHSLLATQLVSRIRTILKIDVPLKTVFEMPTIEEFVREVERLRDGGVHLTQVLTIVRTPREPFMPASFAQRRLWFLQKLEPISPAYNCAASLRLDGSLNAIALEAAIDTLARRHETLRTRLVEIEGEPVQCIDDHADVAVRWVDLENVAVPSLLADSLAETEARRPFNLETGPLFRVCAIRIAPQIHQILFTLHHVLVDGWSVEIFLRELAVIYRAVSADSTPVLEDLSIQYADFAVWQRSRLKPDNLVDQLEYWKKELDGLQQFQLAADQFQHPVASQGFLSTPLGDSRSKAITKICVEQGVTLFMFLLSALDVVLWGATGVTDIALGTDVANRVESSTEQLIGFFVNQLVLRTDLTNLRTFHDLLIRNRDIALNAYRYQDAPFDQVVTMLRPGDRRGTSPLFSVKITLQNAPMTDFALPGLSIEWISKGTGRAKLDLLFTFIFRPAGIEMLVEYDASRFRESTVARLLRQLVHVLDLTSDQVHVPLATLNAGLVSVAKDIERSEVLKHKSVVSQAFDRLKTSNTTSCA